MDKNIYMIEACKVDFLTEQWERELYAKMLKNAKEWSDIIDKKNKEVRKLNNLKLKYNEST